MASNDSANELVDKALKNLNAHIDRLADIDIPLISDTETAAAFYTVVNCLVDLNGAIEYLRLSTNK